VQATADDVIVTCGAQHGLDLIGRVLIEPGTRVAIEDPGYAPARLLFESLSANVVGVGVDEEGLIVDSLPDDARVVYVTPAHQYPLGVSMSEARRLALLRWARERNAVVIEDDYDSELRFGGRPADTLQAMDRSGCVVHLGTFSKTMLPCLRLGFVIAPESLREPLKTALFVGSRHCHWPTQAAMAEFIKEGLFARHARKMRREYARRHQRIVQVLREDFAAWLEPIAGLAGMHVSAFLRLPVDVEARIAAHAEAAGVGLQRLSPFYSQQPARAGLTLGYGAIGSELIDEGLLALRRSIELSLFAS
jgi:GntR family transcriptional regulator / MocR family aminotransferase